MDSPQQKPLVTVIGGGLVGILQAVFLAKNGYQVNLHEKEKDPKANWWQKHQSCFIHTWTRGT